MQFKVTEVSYMGNIVTSQGMKLKPDRKKSKAIVEMPKPEDKKSLQRVRLLGMVKYLSQYIPNESDITAPLQTQGCNNVPSI